MIGIDIVDLNDPLLKKRNDRSVALISSSEDKKINHPQIFWLLWAAKEAVFKTERTIKNFRPREIPITLSLDKHSNITFTSGKIKGQILVDDHHILAIANKKSDLDYFVLNEKVNNWSSTIRQKITECFSEKGVSVSVSKSGTLPLLNDKLPLSITHHGDFAAFAYPNSFLKS
jgi:phosphopantetheinyl transferase (holo-ACP synthase)